MSEELFNSGEEYLRFMRDNCERCGFGSVIENDYGDGENKTVYRCSVQKNINDSLCDDASPKAETIAICKDFALNMIDCPYKAKKRR